MDTSSWFTIANPSSSLSSRYADQPVVVQHSCATCMATMKKYMNEWDAVGCLIVGTETKQVSSTESVLTPAKPSSGTIDFPA